MRPPLFRVRSDDTYPGDGGAVYDLSAGNQVSKYTKRFRFRDFSSASGIG